MSDYLFKRSKRFLTRVPAQSILVRKVLSKRPEMTQELRETTFSAQPRLGLSRLDLFH